MNFYFNDSSAAGTRVKLFFLLLEFYRKCEKKKQTSSNKDKPSIIIYSSTLNFLAFSRSRIGSKRALTLHEATDWSPINIKDNMLECWTWWWVSFEYQIWWAAHSRFSGCEFKEPEKNLFYEIVNLLVKQFECPNELKSIIAANYRQSHLCPKVV